VENEKLGRQILVLGCTGMLGNAVMRFLSGSDGLKVWGTARSLPDNGAALSYADRVISGIDVENVDSLIRVMAQVQPTVVINCIGLVKQLAAADDPLQAIPVNSMLPHRLAWLTHTIGARLVHISTDCVFSGQRGMYRESDTADAQDLYGRSKHLGEVDYPNAVTLRTSIIGHELKGAHGLVGWFLAQPGRVNGYTRAVFSGLPTVELARVIRDHVFPRPEMRGVYHVSSEPISKHDLLQLIATEYRRENEIVGDDRVVIDRSLDSSRFRQQTGYSPPAWRELVHAMHVFG
jgi:dTDP-4-dehydrorhamnose reductase